MGTMLGFSVLRGGFVKRRRRSALRHIAFPRCRCTSGYRRYGSSYIAVDIASIAVCMALTQAGGSLPAVAHSESRRTIRSRLRSRFARRPHALRKGREVADKSRLSAVKLGKDGVRMTSE
jgi:hypothetical protein